MVLYIIFGAVILTMAAGYFFIINNRLPELTVQQLKEFSLKAKQLNDDVDFSLVKNGTNYNKDIGIYNGRVVQFAFKCWGDLCPDNGAFFITYKDVSPDDCSALGGFVVKGYNGFGGYTYGGCSPIEQ